MNENGSKWSVLQETVLSIVSELSLDLVLQKITDAAREVADARYAALGVAREDLAGLSRFIVSGVTEAQVRAIGEWPRGLGLLGTLLQDPHPLRIRDISQDPRSIGFPPHHPAMTSFLGVPIVSRGRILGNLYLTDKIGADEFTQEDERIIISLAGFAAVAIINARLYTENEIQLSKKILEVEKAERQLKFLVELSAMLPSGPLLGDVPFAQILKQATGLLGDACAVYLVDPDNMVTRKIVVHRDPQRAKAAEDLIDESWDILRDQVLKMNRSVFVADAETIPGPFVTLDTDQMRAHRFSAAMVIVIRSAKQVYGAFLSFGSQPLRFTPDDLSFGMLFSQRLGTAMENRALLQELNDAVKARDEFISVATHELKTPATTLMGYADLALRSAQSDPKQLLPILEVIKKQTVRVAALGDQLLDASRIDAGRLELRKERLNLPEFVTEVVDRFRMQQAAEDQARLSLRAATIEMWVMGDAMRLEQVLVNLLSNAFKYSPQGGDVEVLVEKVGQHARVSVKDRGIGIPEAERARVFEPFFRATTAIQAKTTGAGLGLHISREIVEHHGGELWFQSTEGQGTQFSLSLPLGGGSTSPPSA